MLEAPSPSRGRLGWGWVSVAKSFTANRLKPIPTLTLPLKGREFTRYCLSRTLFRTAVSLRRNDEVENILIIEAGTLIEALALIEAQTLG
ncbi:hypothetical protein [Undibacterium sp. Tian12W]|uniref:hypothetical protein n=1 Tax=Undibacterium sp. Tian12W TaxID=3413054 RepID=UPI003BF3975A